MSNIKSVSDVLGGVYYFTKFKVTDTNSTYSSIDGYEGSVYYMSSVSTLTALNCSYS